MLGHLALVLLAALVCGMIARRLGMPAMTGQLAAGVLLGPSLLGTVLPESLDFGDGDDLPLVSAVGTLGVVLLVGLAAVDLDGPFLRRRVKVVASVGLGSFAVPLATGVGAGLLIPQAMHGESTGTTEFALLLGTALSVSAIPVIARILTELDLLRKEIGQLTLATGTLTDIAAWVILAVVSAMTTSGLGGGRLPLTLGALVGVLVATAVLRRPVSRALDRLESSRHEGQTGGIVVLILIACAAITGALNLEPVLGAFLGGVMIGRRGDAVLAPLRAVTTWVLAPVFLAGAGLHLDLHLIADPVVAGVAAAVVLAAVVSKFVGTFVGARVAGVPRWDSAALGAGLNARGVVEIVIATAGLHMGVFSAEIYMIVVLLAVITSIMAGPWVAFCVARGAHAGPRTDIDDPDGADLDRVDLDRADEAPVPVVRTTEG
ncbi:cation:proton antiporter [Gordonia sp. NB41Y]|uniref:cation:proton antiporter n=1 Tax=Gordonia sp. NB41Y TaxID=875808 RepID=UPI0009EC0358|nr:cation:proton antiporter [Gordonia sp. NB41Y]WLP90904.1 cation:proton antiporter [Gordonia sp. NB41Y]